MPPLQLPELFNLGHWFDGDPGPPSPYYLLAAALLLAGLAGSAYLSFFHVPRRYADHAFKARTFYRFGLTLGIFCAVGLVLIGLRYLALSILSARLLLYLDLLGILGGAGFAVYYFVRMYPGRLVAYDAEALRRRYLPKPVRVKGKVKQRPKKERR